MLHCSALRAASKLVRPNTCAPCINTTWGLLHLSRTTCWHSRNYRKQPKQAMASTSAREEGVVGAGPDGGIEVDLLPPQTKGCIWDMDGTLLASNDARVHSWAIACQRHGLRMDKDKYMAETGKTGRDIVDQLCKEQGADLSEEERAAVVREEGEVFQKEGLGQARPIPVVMGVAAEAAARGLPMAVASGGEHGVVDKALETHGIKGLFCTVVTSHDVDKAKPEPDIFLLAAQRLGVPISECVVFEDAPLGLEAAQRAGALRVVDVTTLMGHPDRGYRHGRE